MGENDFIFQDIVMMSHEEFEKLHQLQFDNAIDELMRRNPDWIDNTVDMIHNNIPIEIVIGTVKALYKKYKEV